ncbi:MAG: insulinase family protein, partial [Treponema sp.]|nr:insulinase family protein [Treponema sp.]
MGNLRLEKGRRLESGFAIIDVVELGEIKAQGVWARHDSGAEVFHIVNDDSENLFAFAFATAPENDTGVAHVLEHVALCGSKNYPVKDAFLVLSQGSLQTFLNAMTYPDKTVYPASSENERDYFNLMSVYGDAVFRPLLGEWAFMQEGCRREIVRDEDGEERLSITGVVYNEMKGAYSSLDAHAGLWSTKSVLPDTPYGFESGGNPDRIPDLDLGQLRDFHAKKYSPANCRIFLAGNIPTEKQLDFINKNFLSGDEAPPRGEAAPLTEKQRRMSAPKELKISGPACGEIKSTIFISWLCAEKSDTDELIALAALEEILLGHDGSPLLKALIESGLGEDVSPVTGLDGGPAEAVFTIGLRGVESGAEKEVEALILGELERLAREGLQRREIEAALQYMEFSQREIKRAGGPFSLVWMSRCLRSWMRGGKPWDSLLVNAAIKKIKDNPASDYFESLIRKFFLENPHRALVTVEPREDFLPEQEARLARELEEKLRGMGAREKQGIIDKCAEMEKEHEKEDDPKALMSIPHLSRGDLSDRIEIVPRAYEMLGGAAALCHDIHTNGISYFEIALPLDVLPRELYAWLPFFCRASTSVGLPGMDYAEVSSLFAQTVGGFAASLEAGSAAPSDGAEKGPFDRFDLLGRDWIVYRMK